MFSKRKQEQRSSLLLSSANSIIGTTLLEIGVWDWSFASVVSSRYNCKIIWYDIQNLLSPTSSLEAYYIWWYDILTEVFQKHKVDGILIAYTLHHMTDIQIKKLLTFLQSFWLPLYILEETYHINKSIVVLNDILSNILQYSKSSINRNEYFTLNFKKDKDWKKFFIELWYTISQSNTKLRYGYLHTVWYVLHPSE